MSERRFITQGDGLPRWTNPISHAVVAGNTCYVSGQLSVGEEGSYIAGPVYEEAERAFANFFAALRAAGFAREEVVFIDLAFADLADLGEVNKLFSSFFPEKRRPARTIYQAAALPFGGKIKVTGVAVKD